MENQQDRIYGRGPVKELLRGDSPVDSLLVQKGREDGTISVLVAMAVQRGIPVKQVDVRKLDELSDRGNHQGVLAFIPAARYAELEELLAAAGDAPPFLVIADGIEDPHNLGAIIRTAEGAGAHGLIIPKRRSVGLTGIVAKSAAGATEHLPVARVTNLAAAIDTLKEKGLWIYGAHMEGQSYHQVDFSGPAALVLGSEGKGLSRLVREKCDVLVSLPMRGKMSSLNVSVAAGILLYQMARCREK